LVIKALNQDSESDPDPYPDPDSLEMLDPDLHMDPDSSESTTLVTTAPTYRRKMWYVTYLAPFYSTVV
jgi:hypothetical protein